MVTNVGWQALVPRLVAADRIGRAVSWLHSSTTLGGMVGSLVGGLLIERSGSVQAVFLMDAASFAVLALGALAMGRQRRGPGAAPESGDHGTTGGWTVLRRDPILGPLTIGLLAFITERPRRDRRSAIGEIGDPGVGVTVVVGSDRADHHCQRALGRCHARSLPPRLAIGAIARPVLIGFHRMVDKGDFPFQRSVRRGLQRLERGEINQFRRDPGRRSGRGIAQRGDVQRLRIGRGQLRRLYPAHPTGNAERLGPDIGKAQRLQPFNRPDPRRSFAFGPRHARTHLGGQIRQDLPRGGFGFLRRDMRGKQCSKERGGANSVSHLFRFSQARCDCKPVRRYACCNRDRPDRARPDRPALRPEQIAGFRTTGSHWNAADRPVPPDRRPSGE